ncbi:HIT domain-containing protein [Clavibacter michiganensis subsp. michiganensis]|uniref:HIT family protein n=1 Tax=Clavibacter michiganensis TaxID=28447 RepID=UPI000B8D0653|nr:HIT domain-containing protein [Clavibacter michiganensis subsp. michiganensis]
MTAPSALELPHEDRCAFCDYLLGLRPYSIVTRQMGVAVFVTREQRGSPHLLVLPQEHRPSILDLTDDEAQAIGVVTRNVARAINAKYAPPGISVWQNNGIPAHQVIPHFHVHVAGTLPSGGTNWGSVEEEKLSETDRIACRIRDYLMTPR